MQPLYEHRQYGMAMLGIMLFPVVGLVFAVALTGEPGSFIPLLLILAFMLLTAVIFGSLTVKVDPEKVRLHFGLNSLGRTFPLDRITAVREVRNSPWMGLGIHFIHNGMIYNVSGLDGVEITLDNGRLVRIGTDEPAALAQAIEAARRNPQSRSN